MKTSRWMRGVGILAIGAVAAAACTSATDSADGDTGEVIVVEDNFGEQEVPASAKSVVATDNTSFQTLSDWGVELTAGAVTLMPDTSPYKTDDDIIDLGSHREPNLEAVVAVEPDLIINGNRYGQYRDDFKSLAPDAAIVEVSPRDDEPLDDELKRETTVLGEVFGKESEAEALNEAFDESIARVQDAYDSDTTVMGVIVSGGQIRYVVPGKGRTIGPLFDIFDFTPALEVPEGSDDHQGDDISVEAIAASNPDLILVMDRDAAISGDEEGFTPAQSVIEDSAALQNVPAVKDGAVVYMPADTYTNESIQTYTAFFDQLAERLDKLDAERE